MIFSKNKYILQENQYKYPYHYFPEYVNNQYKHAQYISWGHEYMSYVNKIISEMNMIKFKSLMDLGCGDGKFLYECSKKFSDKKLIGVDISDKALSFAKTFNTDIDFINIDFSKTLNSDFKSIADVLTIVEVLEHIPPDNINVFIKNIHYVLKENGILILTVPSKNIKLNKKHYQHFDELTLLKLFEKNFQIVKLQYLNKINFVGRIIRSCFANRFFILNNKKALNILFNWYNKRNLIANKNNGKRILLVLKKNQTK